MLTSIDICIIHIIFCDSSQNLGFDFENLIASIKHTNNVDTPEICVQLRVRIYKLKLNVRKYLNKPPSPIIFVFCYQIVFLLPGKYKQPGGAILLLSHISGCSRKFKPCYYVLHTIDLTSLL